LIDPKIMQFRTVKNDPLFELIHSLSLSEKGYFKKFSSGFAKGKNKNYLRLFDALASANEFEEGVFRKKFRDEKFIKHLAAEKAYLYHLVLRTLKLYHEGNSVDLAGQDALAKVELLFDRGLYAQAHSILMGAKEKAGLHEKFHLLLEIMDWEYLLPGPDIMKLAEERKQAAAAIDNHVKLQYLFKQIQVLYTRFEKARTADQLKQFEEVISEARAIPALSVTAEINKRFIETYFFSFGLFDLPRACESNRDLIRFMEDHQEVSLERYDMYVIAIGQLADLLFQLKQNDEAFTTLDKLRSLNPGPVKYKGNIFNAYYIRVLAYYNYRGLYEETAKLLPEVEAGIERYKRQMDHFILRYYFIFFNTSFGQGDFKKANAWLHEMINHPFAAELEQRDIMVRLLLLINCYEMDDIDQLEYRLVSVYRNLRKRNKLSKFEQLVLRTVRTLGGVDDKKQVLKIFAKAKEELLELFKDALEKRVSAQFDLIAWLDSKLEGITYADAVKRSYDRS
jgi:hypothetical protein